VARAIQAGARGLPNCGMNLTVYPCHGPCICLVDRLLPLAYGKARARLHLQVMLTLASQMSLDRICIDDAY